MPGGRFKSLQPAFRPGIAFFITAFSPPPISGRRQYLSNPCVLEETALRPSLIRSLARQLALAKAVN
ncbi:MAG: hypothetical protein CFK52_07985 [Chloracidobacterium sp. CP2_5A]|nr:MAG: hypothetical protein CFK52_07985 [Chloracidobacterium sp. CP2_5A]